jgi:putative transposase
MPRKLRTCLPEVTYHTISRCIEKRELMKPMEMKDLMLVILNKALNKYSFDLVAYTIMDNHFHFYIRTKKDCETISRIMQYIKSQYSRRFNKLTDRTGPLWNERFKDTIIEITKNPITLFFYILFFIFYNPVRRKKVSDPRYYTYGSINAYLHEDYISPVKITLHPYFIKLGNSFQERLNKFLVLEEMYAKRIFQDALFAMS